MRQFLDDLAELQNNVDETARQENEKLDKVNLFTSKNNNNK